MENLIADAAIVALYALPFFLLLALGSALADYVLPRCPKLLKFLEKILEVDLGSNDDAAD